MIEVESVGHSYDDGETALAEVSFKLAPQEKAVLLGSNGCGKTTLLRILNGLLFPQTGSYRYHGEEVTRARLREREWNRRFRTEVVLMFQHPEAMLFNPTVFDEIAYGLRQIGADDLDARVRHWARELGVERHLQRQPFGLSGGEKQKVCLAGLLALEPKLLLLDEPTANLDPRSSGWLIDFLQDLPVAALTTTHNIALAGELGDRILVLSEQHRLIFDGPIEKLMADEQTLLAANLVHTHRHRHGKLPHRHPHAHDWS